ncbi:MAG: biotin--[acetyl-CoA-carboxylase] ligase [Rikenellaceae bacterium]
MLYNFDCVSSTNDVALDDKYHHGDVICSERQSAGRGQRGNNWSSGSGLNLTFSVVVEPESLHIREQFSLLRVAALSLVTTLAQYGIDSKIKWTNDIYVGDKKICGLLIENRIAEGFVRKSIIGIGLNINQMEFSPELPNPTSMRSESGREFSRERVLGSVVDNLMHYLSMDSWEDLALPYHRSLYRLGEFHRYRTAQGEEFAAKIVDVAPMGEITLELEDGSQQRYIFGEVNFVI